MDKKDYWLSLSPEQKKAFVAELGSSLVSVSQVIHGHRRPSADFCHRMLKASGGVLSLTDLRPDIWPESLIA